MLSLTTLLNKFVLRLAASLPILGRDARAVVVTVIGSANIKGKNRGFCVCPKRSSKHLTSHCVYIRRIYLTMGLAVPKRVGDGGIFG